MSWKYNQATGAFTSPTGDVAGNGYSGQPPHVNVAQDQILRNLGPIPEGLWKAVELIPESDKLGPYAIRLEPYSQTDAFGRSGFFMHGDSLEHPGFASDGCIILAHAVRELFWTSTDHDIDVTQ